MTQLRHFALITYAVPVERLSRLVDARHFEISTYMVGGRRLALLSAVPFVDEDFHFPGLAPWAKWSFAQTNHRIYGRERATREPAVWFLGTTLGSPLVHVPRVLWSMPWHRARYQVDCHYDDAVRRYDRWKMKASSSWCALDVELEDSGEPAKCIDCFASRKEFLLELTNPVAGLFRRLDGRTGRYEIWHPMMRGLTIGRARRAWFAAYERLGIMTRAEMAVPYSVLILPGITFQVRLPPQAVS